ncbi:MAG: PorV/PorQ family protein [candidate division Zixibacteria bacterium]|nr:PorV/PorQ family protein [candidate division Zixibacteria bacterium]
MINHLCNKLSNYSTVIFFLITLLFLSASPNNVSAHENDYNYNFYSDFLIETPDARGNGLVDGGGVFARGAGSSFYNPANLVTVNNIAAEISTIGYRNIRFNKIPLVHCYMAKNMKKWGYWSIGFNCEKHGHYYSEPGGNWDYPRRELKTTNKDIAISINMAYEINPTFCFGLGVKYIYSNHWFQSDEEFWERDAKTIAFDFGFGIRNILRQLTILNSEPLSGESNTGGNYEGLSLGISVANLGPGISYFGNEYKLSLPTRLRISSGYQIINMRYISLQATLDLTRFLIDIRGYRNRDINRTTWRYGFEASFINLIQLRTGFRVNELYDDDDWPISLSIGPEWLRLGFALEYENRFDLSYKLSLSHSMR